MLFVLVTEGACGRTAQPQPRAQQRMHSEEANHQREGEPQGSREEVAHPRTPVSYVRVSRTPVHEEDFLQLPTERTVKVHQSDDQKFWFSRHSFAAFSGA
jgi:hypothetical protein